MKKLLLKLVLSAGLSSPLLAGTSLLYENFGNNDFGTTPPQIDALAFANYGFFGVDTSFNILPLPYDFQSTINFTNTGTMSGLPGFKFDTASSLGPRRPAGHFFNANNATISSSDFFFFSFAGGGTASAASYLLVSATNIDNQGLLSTGAGGLLDLRGSKLDLSSGGLDVLPLQSSGLPFVTLSNFFPDVAIYDQFWGGVTNQFLDTSSLLRPFGVVSPPSQVTNVNQFPFFTQIIASGLVYYSIYVQTPTPTNVLIQAVFVGLPGPEFSPGIVFAPSDEFGNPYRTAVVLISLPSTDVVTGDPLFEDLFLLDRLASSTNYTTLSNLVAFPPTFRPSNYELTRDPPFEYFVGVPGNSVLTNNIFSDPSYSNVVVTNLYGAYSAFIDSQPVILPPLPGTSVTNLPGRIEIRSDSLDLDRSRMRGNSFIFMDTKHLVGSSNAVVDAPNLTFSLASTNGNLTVQNLIPDFVTRLQGTLNAWSGLWTNSTGSLSTNIGPDPNDPTMTVTNVTTNVVDIGFHALIVDASSLSGLVPVSVHDLLLHSTNVVINDNPQVIETFRVESASLTVNGSLSLSSGARDWTAATAPGLFYFTNAGTLSIGNNAVFGSDRLLPYTNFVNRGQLFAASMAVRSENFLNTGTINESGKLQINATDATFQGGTIFAGGDVFLNSDTAKFVNHTLNTTRGLHLTVKDSLADSGGSASNRWSCQNGFDLIRKPDSGDLFGTTLQTVAPQFTHVRHTWAAVDRGATVAGYSDNAAVGRLVLNSSTSGHLTFSGTGLNNALYVDFLDLRGPTLTNLNTYVTANNNLVIYFADSNGPAEELNGKLGGRLIWVKDFAGPNSSVDVLMLDGSTIKMNRALRNSTTIDSDGDGVANAFDVYPLDSAAWNGVSIGSLAGAPAFMFSWFVAAGTSYQVESTTNLAAPDWQPLPGYGNVAVANGIISITDTNIAGGASHRFYRIRYNP